MRRLGAFLVVAAGVALLVVANVRASDDGFDAAVTALSEHYDVQPKKIPLMWAVSLCARGVTHGGVRGMRVVQFEHFGKVADHAGFEAIVRSRLGGDWTQAVREWKADGEESLIYVRQAGDATDMVVIDLDHGELDMVRMTMNPAQLARWVEKQKAGATQ